MADEHIRAALKKNDSDRTDVEKAQVEKALSQYETQIAESVKGVELKDAKVKRVAIRMFKGTYVGLGCPDPKARERKGDTEDGADDAGYGYTREHPAIAVWETVTVRDEATGHEMSREKYVRGEVVQLYPLPEHEVEEAKLLCAYEKRFCFSLKEAQKVAKRMIASGCAIEVDGYPPHTLYPPEIHGPKANFVMV
jgi:hypothetical protein